MERTGMKSLGIMSKVFLTTKEVEKEDVVYVCVCVKWDWTCKSESGVERIQQPQWPLTQANHGFDCL